MRRYLFLTVTLVLFFSLAVNAFAATYYVATTGNNNNPGTEAAPWATLAYAAGHISSGDTVIVRGGTYREYFKIGTPNVTFESYPGELPVIDGDENLPGGEWDPLVSIIANDISFDGFEVRESTGIGVVVDQATNVMIRNCNIHETFRMALQIEDTDNVLVEDCDIHHGSKRYWYYKNGYPQFTTPWPPTVSVTNSSGFTIRRCKIRDSYWEGIDIGRNSIDVVVEHCQIYGNYRLQLYLNCCKNVIARYNLIYGTTGGNGPGIWLNSEEFCYSSKYEGEHRIYGNLVANTNRNFWIAGNSTRPVKNVTAYNNTFVEAVDYGVVIASGGSSHIFKNNIIWQTGGTIADVASGIATCDYNLWSNAPSVKAKGSYDPAYALPELAKTSGWNNLKGGDLDGGEFALQDTSPAIDAGTPLGAGFDYILDCNKSVWPAKTVLMDQDTQGSGWEIGADIHVANPTALGAPTGLKVVAEQ